MRFTFPKAVVLLAALWALPVFANTPDGLITSKTKLSLWTAAGIKSSAVHVDTNDAVVTLYGKVASAEQKAMAEKTAQGITGVRSVKNLLQVVAEVDAKEIALADKDVMAHAQAALKSDKHLNNSSISVKSVDKGVLLLTGEARTLSDHVRAVTVVDHVAGVRRVASEVKGPEGFGSEERVMFLAPGSKRASDSTTASDMSVSAGVKWHLLTATQIPSTEINVDTDEGVVTLFGVVPTAALKHSAEVEAAKVDGVKRVQNDLEVVATAQRKAVDAKDEDISRDITLAFKDRTELKGVSAQVKNGVVRLTGTVPSGWDEVNALRLTRLVMGVRSVEDQMKLDDKAS